MNIDWPKMIPMSISAIAACISVYYSIGAQRVQTRIVENKNDIERLGELIETLKVAKAVREYSHDFIDEEFISGENLNMVPSTIAKLLQNPYISSKVEKSEWDLPIKDLESKIVMLSNIRKTLF
jgi:hypothetical protein